MLRAFRCAILIGLIAFIPLQSIAGFVIDFNPSCLSAQEAIYELRLKDANAHLTVARKNQPHNVAVDYLLVVKSMLSYITNESSDSYVTFDSLKNAAIHRISGCAETQGYRDFLLEEVYFYSSVVNGKRGNTLSAANDVRNCYKLGTKVIDTYPNFHAAKKTIGLLSSGFGSLPNNYQKLVQFFGYESSVDHGLKALNEFIQAKDSPKEWALMKREAQFYVASIHLYLQNDKITSWAMIDSLTSNYKSNPLSAFARVNFADKCGRNDEIIRVIQQTPNTKNYGSIPFLQFMMGKAKLNRLDSDADQYLLQYVTNYKGNNYVKSCYQKLSWFALLQDDNKKYTEYITLVKTKGNTSLEEDEQAYKNAQSGIKLDTNLLKTRLLFDGGYYQKALAVIRHKKVVDFNTVLQKTEYFYRKGRVYDALSNTKLAEAFYLEAMREGADLPQYYASYAALYLAELYERTGDTVKAAAYFEKSMSFNANKEYKKSIEHRAKNGLSRID